MRRLAPVFLGCLLLAAAPAPAPPPPVVLHAEVDTTRLTLGDTATLTVRIDHDPAVEVVLPETHLDLPDGIEQAAFARATTEAKGRTVERLIWELRCWQIGRFTLPPVAVSYLGGDHNEARAASRPIDIEVVSVRATADEPPRPMTDPVPLPVNWRLGTMVAAFALLLSAGIAAGIAAWRRREPKQTAPPPPTPPDRVALEGLVRLAHSEALAEGDAERVATTLSAITRRYLEGRLSFPALESTTREVEEWLTGCGEVSLKMRATLLDLLFATDRVKFAQGWATVEELTAQIDRAKGVVTQLGGR